jgi:hypothetical protein
MLRAGGASFESLASKFSTDRDSIWRHWHQHVSAETKAQYLAGPVQLRELAERAAAEGLSLLDYLHVVRSTLLAQFSAMAEAGDGRGVAFLSNSLLGVLREIGRITGELAQTAGASAVSITNNIAVMNSPAFASLQVNLLRALGPYPDARAAVIAALRDLDAETPRALTAPMIDATPVREAMHVA